MSEEEKQKILQAKETVLKAAQEMYQKGMTIGTSGNISLRTEKKGTKMVITPSGKDYDEVNADDMIVIDFSGEKFEVIEGTKTPSSETNLHILIYKKRMKDVNAIIHYHPIYSTALGLVVDELPAFLDDQVFFLGHPVTITKEYAQSGSKELADHVSSILGDSNAIIIRNHGSIGLGKNMKRAFYSCQLLEKTAQIYLLAKLAGNVKLLDEKAIKAGSAIFKALK